MSVRGYIVIEEDVKRIDGKTYTHEEEEYLFDLWRESEIFDVLFQIANDFTNDECVGFMEISEDIWEEFKETVSWSEKNSKTVNKYKDVFQRIDSLFKDGREYVKINCY